MLVQHRLQPLMLFVAAAMLTSCTEKSSAPADAIIVFNAGSLARPLRAALDSFTAGTNIRVEQENAGSVETARKLTDLHRIPDLVGSEMCIRDSCINRIRQMERILGAPILEISRGGAKHGSAKLTPLARRLIDVYYEWHRAIVEASDNAARRLLKA